MTGVVVVLVAAYVAWCALLFFMQGRMIFPAHFAGKATEGLPREGHIEQMWIEPSPGVRVEAWFVRADADAFPGKRPMIVFFHGNAELIEFDLDVARMYRRRGMHVLLPEYRGYGRSSGRPGQSAIVADAAAFLERALARDDVDGERVVYHGRSLGAGVACALSERRAPAAMILTSAFTSVAAMGRRYLVPSLLVRHPFRNDRAVRRFDGPLLIMHGAHDGIIPVSHGRRLHEIASRSAFEEIDAGHNDFPPDWVGYEERIDAFLASAGLVEGAVTGGTATD